MTSDPVTRHLSAELRNLARIAAQCADVLDADQEHPSRPEAARESGTQEGGSPKGEVPPAAAERPPPVVFSCAMCFNRTVWRVPGYAKPWPSALCPDCYAEMRMRRDEIQDAAVGYTGVR